MGTTDWNDPERLLQRGREQLLEQPATAVACLERALELQPGHPQALEALGLLADGYLALKRFRECGFLLESVVELDPSRLDQHVRLCAFRLTRAYYRKAAEGLRLYLDGGGTPSHLERELTAQQHPKSVIRALRALCDILHRVSLAELPHFKNMGEILAFEEKLSADGRPELAASVSQLPGVSEQTASRLSTAGYSSVGQLAAASVQDLVGLGFEQKEAETLVDVANSEIYLVNTQGGRPPESR